MPIRQLFGIFMKTRTRSRSAVFHNDKKEVAKIIKSIRLMIFYIFSQHRIIPIEFYSNVLSVKCGDVGIDRRIGKNMEKEKNIAEKQQKIGCHICYFKKRLITTLCSIMNCFPKRTRKNKMRHFVSRTIQFHSVAILSIFVLTIIKWNKRNKTILMALLIIFFPILLTNDTLHFHIV